MILTISLSTSLLTCVSGGGDCMCVDCCWSCHLRWLSSNKRILSCVSFITRLRISSSICSGEMDSGVLYLLPFSPLLSLSLLLSPSPSLPFPSTMSSMLSTRFYYISSATKHKSTIVIYTVTYPLLSTKLIQPQHPFAQH